MVSSDSKPVKQELKARHKGRNVRCLAFLLFLLFIPSTPCTAEEDHYLADLIAQARERKLHEHRYWEILLHYKPSFRGLYSLIDDPRFFLAEDGKINPQSELAATLEAFFQSSTLEDEHPRCRFVARYAWLKEELGIDESRLPPLSCEEFHRILDKVQPRSAVLIFPTTHNNSPASMFGHTLIIIEGPYKSRLLSYAVNYTAVTGDTSGIAFAVKGIFGLYPGYFSIRPYYEKLREYSDLKRRDVWEYELNLTEEEVTRMFLHIWELREIYSDYYFFGENCSYDLLFLLEAARPSLRLTDQTRPWVIPIDTVRIARDDGLVTKATYRPSKSTRISHIASRMNLNEEKLAVQVIDGEVAPEDLSSSGLTAEEQIRVLDLSAETIEFRYFKEEFTREEYRRSYLALLNARSKLGRPEGWDEQIPVPGRPDLGHGSNRFSLGVGFRDDDFFEEVSIRPAYHNLLDSDEGYLVGSQIDFANLVLRHYPDRRQLELHALDLISIVSISPRSRFFKPTSWKVNTGFIQKIFDDKNDHLVYQLNPGRGLAYQIGPTLFYSMLEADLLVSGRFRDSYALGIGGLTGLLTTPTDLWKLHLWGRKIYYEWGDDHHGLTVHLDQSLKINPANSLALELSRNKEYGVYYTEANVKWNYYW
jgi:hypothetical protein